MARLELLARQLAREHARAPARSPRCPSRARRRSPRRRGASTSSTQPSASQPRTRAAMRVGQLRAGRARWRRAARGAATRAKPCSRCHALMRLARELVAPRARGSPARSRSGAGARRDSGSTAREPRVQRRAPLAPRRLARCRARSAALAAGASARPNSSAFTQRNVPPHTMGTLPRARTSSMARDARSAHAAASTCSSGSSAPTRWCGARAQLLGGGLARADVEAAVDLDAVGADDLAAEPLGERRRRAPSCPLAVGPDDGEELVRVLGARERRSALASTTDASLELVVADARHHRPAVRAVAGEVDVVERAQERHRLLARERVAGADAAVAGHRREHEVGRVAEGRRAARPSSATRSRTRRSGRARASSAGTACTATASARPRAARRRARPPRRRAPRARRPRRAGARRPRG